MPNKAAMLAEPSELYEVNACARYRLSQMEIIGKYERNENSPSVEMALKIAKVFDVAVDYLLGEGKHTYYDNETVKRLKDIQKVDRNTKSSLFNIIDTFFGILRLVKLTHKKAQQFLNRRAYNSILRTSDTLEPTWVWHIIFPRLLPCCQKILIL